MNIVEVPQKKLYKILKAVNPEVVKLRIEINELKSALEQRDSIDKEIDKRYKGVLKVESIEQADENGTYNVRAIRIYSKTEPKILFELMYSGSGITAKMGENPYAKGIYLAKFSDFDCNILESIIYNKYGLYKTVSYNIKIDSNGAPKGTVCEVDRDDESFLGKLFSKKK